MSRVPETPRAPSKGGLDPKTPTGARATVVQSSPHYTTARRHSLYGTEDRVVLDPGSRVWKVGFSGEGRPRDVYFVGEQDQTSLWSLSRPLEKSKEEEERILEAKIQQRLRTVFHQSLLTDPKSRKVIIAESPLLPLYVKDIIARVLFNNLHTPSISFASSHLLSLIAVGRITGLVLDCGYLESTALPIFASRPLFPQLRTTPLAGSRLTSHLRALLLMFGTYIPPLSSLGTAANIPTASRSLRVPEDLLSDKIMEKIKTSCCFVGNALDFDAQVELHDISNVGDNSTEFEVPSSDASVPESDFSRVSAASENSGFSIVSNVRATPDIRGSEQGESHLQALATMYKRHSSATDLKLPVDPPPSQNVGTGRGTLLIPGWVRERAAEVLFEDGDVDESSVAEVILDSLLKIPVDLRKIMASSILVVGGTAMLPGFIPRLQTELLRVLTREPKSRQSARSNSKFTPPAYDPYANLRPLIPHIAILNNPSPMTALSPSTPTVTVSSIARNNTGKAPAFAPFILPWVGGSLAGALKVSGEEIGRDKWDEADGPDDDEDEDDMEVEASPTKPKTVHVIRRANVLPDWTRPPLKPAAPPANAPIRPPVPVIAVQTPRRSQRIKLGA